MGGTGVDFGQAIAVDNAGNVYSTGLLANTADFDLGLGILNLTSAGANDAFVIKLNEIQALPVELIFILCSSYR